MFNNIGTTEVLIMVLLLIIIFGGNKVNDIARGLGEATKEIKKAKKEVENTKDELKKEPVVTDSTSRPSLKKKKSHLKKVKK